MNYTLIKNTTISVLEALLGVIALLTIKNEGVAMFAFGMAFAYLIEAAFSLKR